MNIISIFVSIFIPTPIFVPILVPILVNKDRNNDKESLPFHSLDIQCKDTIASWQMKNSLIIFINAGLAILACLAFTGCETESADSQITITPDSTTIRKGESVEFTASGGVKYTWSIEDAESTITYGHLSTRTGNKTVYTSIVDPDSDAVVRILTVKSTIEGIGETNSTPQEWTAKAYITHL